MKFNIHTLKEGENRFHYESFKEGWLKTFVERLSGKGYDLKGNFEASFALTKLEPDYYLRGRLKGRLERVCDRCAEGFELPLDHRYEVALSHVSTQKRKEVEIGGDSESVDIILFDENEIDVEPVMEEQFILSVPFKNVCRTDCQGICQQCGQNLNSGSCQCPDPEKETPFSVLKSLKK